MDPVHVLIVDDEPNVTRALCRALSLIEDVCVKAEGCDCAEAARTRLAEQHFDVLVTDLCLEGADGLALLEEARTVSPATRGIMITALGSPQVERAVRDLACLYLPKPFGLAQFVQAVREILARN